jgi:hypothetical protein
MTETQGSVRDVQGDIIKTVNQSQDALIEVVRDWTDAVQAITPKLPAVNVPFANKVPQPEQLVTSAYDFAEQLLRSQRRFAEELIKATAPLLPIPNQTAHAKAGAK